VEGIKKFEQGRFHKREKKKEKKEKRAVWLS
jgi:hypothetical protein